MQEKKSELRVYKIDFFFTSICEFISRNSDFFSCISAFFFSFFFLIKTYNSELKSSFEGEGGGGTDMFSELRVFISQV